MSSPEYSLTWESDADSVDEIEKALADLPYDEVETRSADGTIHGMLWMMALQVAKPVLTKVGAFVDKHLTEFMNARKVGKVTIKKDGQVIIENATPAQIKKVLKEIEERNTRA